MNKKEIEREIEYFEGIRDKATDRIKELSDQLKEELKKKFVKGGIIEINDFSEIEVYENRNHYNNPIFLKNISVETLVKTIANFLPECERVEWYEDGDILFCIDGKVLKSKDGDCMTINIENKSGKYQEWEIERC
jgi:hypothetical protein